MYILSLSCPLSALVLVGSIALFDIVFRTAIRAMYRLSRALKPNELTVRANMGGGGVSHGTSPHRLRLFVGLTLWMLGIDMVGVRVGVFRGVVRVLRFGC